MVLTQHNIDQWLDKLSHHVDPTTLAKHRSRAKHLVKWVKRSRSESTESWNDFYRHIQKADDIQPISARLYMISARAFYSWMGGENPVKVPRVKENLAGRGVISFEEYRALLKVAGTCYDTKPWWHYAIVCAWETGFRISDVALLRWPEVDLKNQTITRMLYKTRRYARTVCNPFNRDLNIVLQDLWDNRAPEEATDYVQPYMAHLYKQYSTKILCVEFRELATSVGVDKTFHCFRHSFITRALHAGILPETVADLAGVSRSTIATYLHVTMDHKQDAMRKLSYGNQMEQRKEDSERTGSTGTGEERCGGQSEVSHRSIVEQIQIAGQTR